MSLKGFWLNLLLVGCPVSYLWISCYITPVTSSVAADPKFTRHSFYCFSYCLGSGLQTNGELSLDQLLHHPGQWCNIQKLVNKLKELMSYLLFSYTKMAAMVT